MSFFEKKYKVTGWHGDTQSLTAKKLYERVLEDSKSDYNWVASATELVIEYAMIRAFQKCML